LLARDGIVTFVNKPVMFRLYRTVTVLTHAVVFLQPISSHRLMKGVFLID